MTPTNSLPTQILKDLPSELAERTLDLTGQAPREGGEFVLYWAHHALRAHDNPALEAAAFLAIKSDRPLLIYQGLGGRHRYNSDRHHHFILESARDFSSQLVRFDQRLVFHLPSDPNAKGTLTGLLNRATAVVSELYPVPPFTHWYQKHATAHPDLCWWLVDASTLLPMTALSSRPTRAFQFRQAHSDSIIERARTQWPVRQQWPKAYDGPVGFEPFDFNKPFTEAIAGCQIDHSIPAVKNTRGGSAAGYLRWESFLQASLDHYHLRRNDAAQPEAVSRLSPYLHYGCVSPFRIAREALAHAGEGADKFLDELLTWRELSHHFCYHSTSLESLDAVPEWAQQTLQEHESDPRVQTYDWETLSRGQTGETLWDLCQQSLLRHGELHNNLRMTWGKSFLRWAQKPRRSLKLMIDLNHRYALDGSDPNSYGGLLWCLGQFDRPFPPGPIFGKVRQRSLTRHAKRLDMGRYAQWVSKPARGDRLRVVVIGAGLTGLSAARSLQDQGHEVVVVEKARGPGGRMSTRRQDDLRFDHGAQYFTARDPRFLRHVLGWCERGLVTPWEARIGAVTNTNSKSVDTSLARYIPIPSMNQICREMAAELNECHYGWRAAKVEQDPSGWQVTSETGETVSGDILITTTPPEQATALLQDDEVTQRLEPVTMTPCWAVMALLDRPALSDVDAAFVNEGPLSWISSQSSRPQRPDAHAWVLHGNPQWSADTLEWEPADAAEHLLEAMRALHGSQSFEVLQATAHRWRYALDAKPLSDGALWFPDKKLVIAGDWCNGSKVEGAFLSGTAAAGRVLSA